MEMFWVFAGVGVAFVGLGVLIYLVALADNVERRPRGGG